MRFTAKLITERKIGRSVERFAPDLVNAEGLAREFLLDRPAAIGSPVHGCVAGDAFEIWETRQVLVARLRRNEKGEVEREVVG